MTFPLPISKSIFVALFTIFLTVFSLKVLAQPEEKKLQNNSVLNIEYLQYESEIKHIFDYNDDVRQLDSLCISLMNWSDDKPVNIRLKAIYNYFERSNYRAPLSFEKGLLALKISEKGSLNDAVLSRIYLARLYIENRKFSLANKYLDEAIAISSENNEIYLLGFSYLEKGEFNTTIDENKRAITNYLNAVNLAEEHKNERLYYLSCTYLSNFFSDEDKDIPKALDYSRQILDYAIEMNDSNAIVWAQLDVQKLMERNGNYDFDYEIMEFLFDYAKRRNNQKLTSYIFASYRGILINQNRFEDLEELCLIKYPQRFERLGRNQYHLYCRIKALIFESRGQIDSAFYYFNLAKAEINDETNSTINDFMVAHFNQRFGEFLVRNKKVEQAIVHFINALDYFSLIGYELRSEQISKEIELAYSDLGDIESAYKYATISREFYDAYLSKLEKEALLTAEFEHEIENRKEESALAEERRKIESENERKKRTVLSFGLALFLLLSGVSYYQFRLTRKERNKSNELLLNILPETTAEELKKNGKTTAKRYENATVLFSDIKEFTLIAERLSPEELVNELDIYFTRFDEIVKAHGLEKIKTIGDAYLAVGGLPDGNSATAQNVVKCGTEIIAFTKNIKEEKEKLGLPFFEIRIGINTGPVVAGVVGKDKFQYDIWGDAVNIAARMEQTSEIGKINISRSTYLKIKDEFSCYFRGKINAKNKGEIEMYFVELF